ncbi:hypothetical protein BU656_11760, partial [Staphylococcus chromogenes]|uniref:hypothetical protein n=1 Tax=Staphylococcus chromogenes TaxID=46126 RepID=UPI000D4AEA8F
APDDSVACIRVVRGQQRALLQIGKQWAAQSAEDKRSTILHELIHIWCWQMDDAVDAAAPHLGTVGAALLDAQHEIAVERAVDGIAVAIAPFFPLPTNPKVEP